MCHPIRPPKITVLFPSESERLCRLGSSSYLLSIHVCKSKGIEIKESMEIDVIAIYLLKLPSMIWADLATYKPSVFFVIYHASAFKWVIDHHDAVLLKRPLLQMFFIVDAKQLIGNCSK